MKAHISAPRKVTRAVLEAAEKIASDQADDIAARTANEVAAAMYECGLSPRTIARVMNYYNDVVGPRWVEYRKTGDGDMAMKIYAEDHDLPYMVCTKGRC